MRPIKEILQNEEAVTSTEYAVMLALILIAIIGAIGSIGSQTNGMWTGINGKLQAVGIIR